MLHSRHPDSVQALQTWSVRALCETTPGCEHFQGIGNSVGALAVARTLERSPHAKFFLCITGRRWCEMPILPAVRGGLHQPGRVNPSSSACLFC